MLAQPNLHSSSYDLSMPLPLPLLIKTTFEFLLPHGENMELGCNTSNGGTKGDAEDDDVESSCSTPYCSAPSSPRGGAGAYFFSAPASPVHFVLSAAAAAAAPDATVHLAASGSFEFEFSARGSTIAAADEIFLNGQIRPTRPSSHLQRPQAAILAPPPLDACEEEGPRGRDPSLRSRSVHRRARSMSPLRKQRFPWQQEEEEDGVDLADRGDDNARRIADPEVSDPEAAAHPPSVDSTPAISGASSASGRSSKRWIFLKDLLYRSKSEGRGNGKEKFWMSLSFSSPSKDRSKASDGNSSSSGNASAADPPALPEAADLLHGTAKPKAGSRKVGGGGAATQKPANGVAGRIRGSMASAHERHYTCRNRTQAEEMRWRTFLPYRHGVGVLGCLGLSSRGYGAAAMNGFARSLNPVSSR